MMKLAISGGKPVLKERLPTVYNIDSKEINSVVKVMKKGPLSGFVASWDENFYGGKMVKKLESDAVKMLKVPYAVTFNSATSALQAAIAALSIGPGDEVIVPPYTMSATATCVILNGAVPIFADIEDRTFCLDPKEVEKKITKSTKAVIVVNLFGAPARLTELMKLAKKYNLKIIEDNAQAFGAKYRGKYAGTIGDIGVFSFNVHKIIQSGEGGLVVTRNKGCAMRARLFRNHGEVVADQMPNYKLGPIVGGNFRMSEVTAAIAIEQLKKLDLLTKKRINLATYLTKKLKRFDSFITPLAEKHSSHVYYLYPFRFLEKRAGISRDLFVDAMEAEGFPMSKGYVKPLYLMRMFRERKVFNHTNFPFVDNYYPGKPKYTKGLCPVCERMWEKELTFTDICQYPRTNAHIDLLVEAIEKVLANKEQVLDYANNT